MCPGLSIGCSSGVSGVELLIVGWIAGVEIDGICTMLLIGCSLGSGSLGEAKNCSVELRLMLLRLTLMLCWETGGFVRSSS